MTTVCSMAEEIEGEYTTVRLPKELIDEIDKILKRGVMGYKSRAEFIKESIREKLKTMPAEAFEKPQLPIEHFNISENGVRILDRTIKNGVSNGRIIDVYFKPKGIWCEYCQTNNCRHIQFALTVPKIREIVKKKRAEGWKLPETE